MQGAVYDHDAELIEISAKAYEMFMWSNPLHADVFKVVKNPLLWLLDSSPKVILITGRSKNGSRSACDVFETLQWTGRLMRSLHLWVN